MLKRQRCVLITRLVVMLLLCLGVTSDEADVMKVLSTTIGTKVYPCLKELHMGNNVLQDIMHYWQPGYPLTSKEVGCTLMCAIKKLHLLADNGHLDKPHVTGFIQASGGGEPMVKTLIELYQACDKRSNSSHPCERALEITNCFRGSIQQSDWLPHITLQEAEPKRREVKRKCGEDVMYMRK